MKENLNDLRAFLMVAQTGSFTKAGAQLGVSASALSHAIRTIEERLQIKLFHRTTRSISLTDAGAQLHAELEPLFEAVDASINNLSNFRNTLRGSLRINGSSFAFHYVLWDKLQKFARQYSEISLELACDLRFVDIVAERFDAGLRLGGDVAKDMIAVRVSPELRMCVAASPAYLAQRGMPHTPDDLAHHSCHCVRLPTSGGVLAWEFKHPKNGKTISFKPHPHLLTNDSELLKQTALADLGLVWIFENILEHELNQGRLVRVLDDWAMTYDGCYLYYPNRRGNSPLLKALVEALRI